MCISFWINYYQINCKLSRSTDIRESVPLVLIVLFENKIQFSLIHDQDIRNGALAGPT